MRKKFRIQKECLGCGTKLEVPKHLIERKKFCSRQCKGKASHSSFKDGHKGYWLDKKHSKESNEKRSEALKDKQKTEEHARKIGIGHSKEKCTFWKGGITDKKRKTFLEARRRAKKKESLGGHSQEEWENLKKEYGYKCLWCGRNETEIKLTQDHILPLSKGGTDNIDNIQPLCSVCNSRKKDKYINFIEKICLDLVR